MTSFPPSSPDPSAEYGAQGQYGSPAGEGQYGQRPGDAPYGHPGQGGASDPALGNDRPHPGGLPPAQAGPAPGTDLAADLGAGLKFAGQAMLRNPVAYLVSGLIYSLLIFVVMLVAVFAGGFTIVALTESANYGEPSFGDLALVYAIIFGVMILAAPLSVLWQSGAARSGVVVLDGGRPSLGQALIGPMRVILTTLLVGVIIAVGTVLLYIPGLIAAVLLFYAIPAAARGASPADALTKSVRLARSNLGTTIVAYLVMMVISMVAGVLPIVLVVLIPFYILFQLGMYERLSRRELPEPARS